MDSRRHSIGQEHQPLLVVDNFVAHPRELVDYALTQHNVLPAGGLYPGLRSPAPASYGRFLLDELAPGLSSCFGASVSHLAKAECYYSMVSTPPAQLSLLQRLPHFDRPNPAELAIIHYLCTGKHGGTSFYRHRSTGYEYITPDRQQPYQQSLKTDVLTHGQPVGYINGSTPLYERIASIPARFNRALIYRCSSLHSGDIPNLSAFDLDPLSGRFTIASFLSL